MDPERCLLFMIANYNAYMLGNNMNFKLALLIVLIIMIMMIALGVVKQYRQRHSLFLELSIFLNEYELNIGFKKEKIKDIILNFNATGEFKLILNNYLENFNDTNNLNFDNIKILQADEKSYLISMFKKLGTSDYENEKLQLVTFKSYIVTLVKPFSIPTIRYVTSLKLIYSPLILVFNASFV